MKIQCSDACVQLLKKLGGFRLESRGSIPIKVCTTCIGTTFILCGV